jgi:hypothetical protein
MSLAPVATVESLCVQAVQPVHARRKALARRFHEQVVMRPHEAPRMNPPAEHLDHLAEEPAKRLAVEVVDVDVRSGDAARRHVEEAVFGELGASSARHLKRK